MLGSPHSNCWKYLCAEPWSFMSLGLVGAGNEPQCSTRGKRVSINRFFGLQR